MYLSYTFDYNGETEDLAAYFGNLYDLRYFQKISSFRHILGIHVYGKILSKSAPSNVTQFYESCEFCTKRICHGRVR